MPSKARPQKQHRRPPRRNGRLQPKARAPVRTDRENRADFLQPLDPQAVLQLQQTVGNRATRTLIRPRTASLSLVQREQTADNMPSGSGPGTVWTARWDMDGLPPTWIGFRSASKPGKLLNLEEYAVTRVNEIQWVNPGQARITTTADENQQQVMKVFRIRMGPDGPQEPTLALTIATNYLKAADQPQKPGADALKNRWEELHEVEAGASKPLALYPRLLTALARR